MLRLVGHNHVAQRLWDSFRTPTGIAWQSEAGQAKARHTRAKRQRKYDAEAAGFKVMGFAWLTKAPALTIPRLWLERSCFESDEKWLTAG